MLFIALLLPLCVASKEHSESLYEDEFAWQLSFGAFYIDMSMPELAGADPTFRHGTILIDAELEYKNFYLNSHSGDFFGGSDIGYQIVDHGNWGVDAIYGSYMLPFSERGYDDSNAVVPELKGISRRKQDNSLGFSYYRHVGEFLAVAELAYDVFGDTEGWIFHLEATRTFELRNWDLWLNFGANYYSSNFNNYYFGVGEAESNGYLFPYQPGAASSVFAQLQLNYPIAKDWVFSAGASWLMGSKNTLDSPLVRSRHARVFFSGVKYVF